MLKKILSKLSPKRRKKDTTNEEKEEEYDEDRVIWKENIFSDFLIYLKNNNILCGIFCADHKHPFTRYSRLILFCCYISFIILISSLVSKHTFICKAVSIKNEQKRVCANKVTVFSTILFILGIYLLHRFVKIITKCAKLRYSKSNHRHNYFVGIILSFIGAQFIVLIILISTIFMFKGVVVFFKIKEPILFSMEMTVIIFAVSLLYEFICNIFEFVTKRSMQIQANNIKNAQFDPHADMRKGNKKKNIYVA